MLQTEFLSLKKCNEFQGLFHYVKNILAACDKISCCLIQPQNLLDSLFHFFSPNVMIAGCP